MQLMSNLPPKVQMLRAAGKEQGSAAAAPADDEMAAAFQAGKAAQPGAP
jgi:hypothetical protein